MATHLLRHLPPLKTRIVLVECGAELWVDRVIDCSGSDHRLEPPAEGLWKQLLNDGLATADRTGVGIRTGRYDSFIDTRGRASARLFYLGPMLRAAHWEATAVGEPRVHASSLARALAGLKQSRIARHMDMPNTGGELTQLLQDGH